jgi:hypothetical protein
MRTRPGAVETTAIRAAVVCAAAVDTIAAAKQMQAAEADLNATEWKLLNTISCVADATPPGKWQLIPALNRRAKLKHDAKRRTVQTELRKFGAFPYFLALAWASKMFDTAVSHPYTSVRTLT